MNKDVGMMLSMPFYWYVGKNLDLTLTANIATRQTPLFNLETRGLFQDRGGYKSDIAFTNSKVYGSASEIRPLNQNVTYLEFISQYTLNLNTDIGINARYAFDKSDAFLKKYAISEDDISLSDFFIRFYAPNNYGYVDVHIADIAQDFRPYNTCDTIIGLPNIRSLLSVPLYTSNNLIKSISLVSDLEFLQLQGKADNSKQINMLSSRFTGIVGLNAELQTRYGLHMWAQPTFDLENVKNRGDLKIAHNEKFAYTNLTPQLNLGANFKNLNSMLKIGFLEIEPMLQVSIMPNKMQRIPYFEQNFLEIDYADIFSSNLRNIIDQTQIGSHIEYGIRGTLYNDVITTFAFGNSVRFYGNKGIKEQDEAGISIYTQNQRQSAYFAQLSLELNESLLKVSQWFAPKKFKPIHTEVDFTFARDKVIFNADYTFFDHNYYKTHRDNYQMEVGAQLWINLYKAFWIAPSGRMNIGPKKDTSWRNRPISVGGSLRYQDDCFTLDVSAVYNYLRLQNLPPSLMYTIKLTFPGLTGQAS